MLRSALLRDADIPGVEVIEAREGNGFDRYAQANLTQTLAYQAAIAVHDITDGSI